MQVDVVGHELRWSNEEDGRQICKTATPPPQSRAVIDLRLALPRRLSHFRLMSIGFKEWALVCEALGRGDQSLILRKGGIAEGRAGFRFQHEEFLLLPTLFHEQAAKLKVPSETPLPAPRSDSQLEVRYHARVEWTQDIPDLEVVRRLAPMHLWQDSEIEKRFRYDEKEGVSLAFIRVSKLSEPFIFPDSPKYGGCRSWVTLPDLPAGTSWQPVLDDATHRSREAQLRQLLQ
jgi:hypothetical protein